MDRRITLLLQPEAAAVEVVKGVAESGARLFGLDQTNALRLTLATEELFLYLVQSAAQIKRMEIEAVPKATGMEMAFTFQAETLDLSALNMTARKKADELLEEEDFARLGLLLVASAVDRMRLDMLEGGQLRLILEQDREYPEAEPEERPQFEASGPVRVEREPAPELLKEACLLALARYPVEELPPMAREPGRLADLAAAGEMRGLVALDARGRVCGLLLRPGGRARTLSFRGPFVFTGSSKESVARPLLDALLQDVARSGATGIMTPHVWEPLPPREYEDLGSLSYQLPNGRKLVRNAFFRMLAEDMGETVWTHPAIEGFLRNEYERLELARDMRPAVSHGEAAPETSVFRTRTRALLAEAEIRPLLPGRDASANIARHVQALRADGLVNILFILDLAHAWQVALAGPLADNGFTPKMVLPLAGHSDLVVLQHEHVSTL